MFGSGSNLDVIWLVWIVCVIFWVFIIILSLLGLKWLVQESDEKISHKFADNPFLKDFINKDKKDTTEKVEDKDKDSN